MTKMTSIDYQSIVFRRANLLDIDLIMKIEDESFTPGVTESRDVFLERIEVFPQGFLIMDAKECLNGLGYISSEIWLIDSELDSDLFTLGHSIKDVHSYTGNMLYISSMGILKEYRGYGLGRKLFNTLIANTHSLYPSITSDVLVVGEPWCSARRIYESEGFKELFTIKNFFEPVGTKEYDGIIMRREK